jgi:hypothetical protein
MTDTSVNELLMKLPDFRLSLPSSFLSPHSVKEEVGVPW